MQFPADSIQVVITHMESIVFDPFFRYNLFVFYSNSVDLSCKSVVFDCDLLHDE